MISTKLFDCGSFDDRQRQTARLYPLAFARGRADCQKVPCRHGADQAGEYR